MKKKYTVHLHLDFAVTVDETAIPTGDDPDEQHYYGPQRRLLEAILADPEKLQSYLCFTAATHLESIGHKKWYELILGDENVNTKMMLAPTISSLSADDQTFFKEAEDEELFYESVEEMDDCFHAQLETAEIVVEADNGTDNN